MTIPTIDDIRAAAGRLNGVAVRTPLLRSDALDKATGAEVLLKAENLQLTGSFKIRGAYNAISQLSPDARAKGVVACSSGNHAQGVGEAARRLGVAATIVMPADAPVIKVERTRASGAKIVFYERASGDRDTITAEIGDQTGATLVHPFDNPQVIAGQGTVGLEIVDDLGELVPDHVLACTGGGGLTAGVALAIHDRFAGAKIHCVEPQGFDDHRLSLAQDKRIANKRNSGSACDALLSEQPGEITFAINRKHLSDALVVSDEQAFAAMRFAFRELKLVLEPGGAVALAALLAEPGRFAGRRVVALLSGGNVDPALFARVLNE